MIGVLGLSAGIINLIIGAGIFALPAVAEEQLGSHAWAAYVVCAVLMMLALLCFAVAGSRVTTTGGPYAYVHAAFGAFPAFLSGVLLWVAAIVSTAAVATVFSDTLGTVFPGVAAGVGRMVVLLLLYGIAVLINVRGVRSGTRTVMGLTVAKVLPLVLLVLVAGVMIVLGRVAPAPVSHAVAGAASSAAYPFTAANVGRTALVLIFAFFGSEVALAPSGEVKQPARTVPMAIGIALGVVTLLYLALQAAAQAVLGPALAQDPTVHAAPLVAAATRLVGPAGAVVLTAAALVSTAGYVLGDALASPRVLYALAADGHLPRVLARIHARYETPAVAVILHGTIAVLLAISGTFASLAILNNVAMLVLYLLCCIAAIVLLRRDASATTTAPAPRTTPTIESAHTPLTLPFGPLIPLLACGALLWLLAHAEWREYAAVAAAIGIATVAYVLGRQRSAVAPGRSS